MTHTYSDSKEATGHLYCAVENRQMSANCRTKIYKKYSNYWSEMHRQKENNMTQKQKKLSPEFS